MREDLPRIFERFCLQHEPPIYFSYGDVFHLNNYLSKNSAELSENEEPIYLFLESLTRDVFVSQTGLRVGGVSYTGAFTILKNSSLDMEYFNEMSPTRSDEKGRYKNNIEPLLPYTEKLAKWLMCEELDLDFFSAIDIINFMDENRDGVLVKFKVTDRRV